jgi:hypothetical protein
MSAIPQLPESQRGKYPGLRPDEAAVLRDWLAVHQGEWDRFDYNVRVGEGTDPGPAYADEIRKSYIMSTQMRVDVVAWRGGRPTLIEVKYRASAAALGQLAVYAHHYSQTFPAYPNPALMVISYTAVTGIPEALARAGIVYQQVVQAA